MKANKILAILSGILFIAVLIFVFKTFGEIEKIVKEIEEPVKIGGVEAVAVPLPTLPKTLSVGGKTFTDKTYKIRKIELLDKAEKETLNGSLDPNVPNEVWELYEMYMYERERRGIGVSLADITPENFIQKVAEYIQE